MAQDDLTRRTLAAGLRTGRGAGQQFLGDEIRTGNVEKPWEKLAKNQRDSLLYLGI